MKKDVMIAIRPKWVELIASGKKTVEVRRTRPTQETPFKCYMYMCRGKWAFDILRQFGMAAFADRLIAATGKVAGEFVCDRITEIHLTDEGYDFDVPKMTCLKYEEMEAYLGRKNGFGWHISDLKIYDKPKDLQDFMKEPCNFAASCGACGHSIWDWSEGYPKFTGCSLTVTRPPQSWQYVYYIEEGN